MTRKVAEEVCDSLRENQTIIEHSLVDDIDEALTYAEKAGLSYVMHFKHGDKVDLYDVERGTIEEKVINAL